MSQYRKSIGQIGEDAACNYLEEHGYSIIERNYRTRFGEIDIIATNNSIVTFVEVKTKVDLHTGKPYEAVGKVKLRHLQKVIQHYLLIRKIKNSKLSLDVISIVLNPDHSTNELKHFRSIDI